MDTLSSAARQPRSQLLRLLIGTVLASVAVMVWFLAGPLALRIGDYMTPNDAAWDDAWVVLDVRFWFTTGTVDFVQALVLQGWHWQLLPCWAIQCCVAVFGRQWLHVRRWLAVFVLVPALVGQALVLLAYFCKWI